MAARKSEKYEARILHEILERVEHIEHLLMRNESLRFQILQIEGGKMGVVKGVVAGGSGTFDSVNIPAGSSDPSGVPSWSADSVLTTVTPSLDGKRCQVDVDSKATVGATFKLTKTAKRSDGADCVGTVDVPVLAPVVSNEATAFDISQTA